MKAYPSRAPKPRASAAELLLCQGWGVSHGNTTTCLLVLSSSRAAGSESDFLKKIAVIWEKPVSNTEREDIAGNGRGKEGR